MSKVDMPTINQSDLVSEWQKSMPGYLNQTDQVKVKQDIRDPQAINIHIDTAGRSLYAFEFSVTYQDSREVLVEVQAVTQDNKPIADHTESARELIKDYVRHIHECAQALQSITHS